MSNILKPKQVNEDAPKMWLKQGRTLFMRVALAMLPLMIVVGLGVAYLIKLNFLLVLPCVVALTGLWHASMLHVCEQAAKGVRVTFLTAFEGAKLYTQLPDQVMFQQMKKRFLIAGVACLVLYLLGVWVHNLDKNPEMVTPPDLTSLQVFLKLCSQWTSVFIWGWAFQAGGGAFSFINPLVRNFGVSWDTAIHLSEQARAMNPKQTGKMTIAFFLMLFTVIYLPVLIFFFELYWMAVMTVAYREVFEEENGLAQQEEREALVLGEHVLQA